MLLIDACCIETPSKWASYVLVNGISARSARPQLARALTEAGESAKTLTPKSYWIRSIGDANRTGSYAQTFKSEITR